VKPLKIAIIGTGIAGLTAGWLFSRAGHAVVLFERAPMLGMDAQAIDFSLDQTKLRCDVPPRLFNQTLWPTLSRLYELIGVETIAVAPSKSFGEFKHESHMRFGDSLFSHSSFRGLFNRNLHQTVQGARRMRAEVADDLNDSSITKLDFSSYLDLKRYSSTFIERFLFPSLASTVCTCSYESLRRYPADVILRAMSQLVINSQLFRAKHGAADVVRRLSHAIEDIRCHSEISSASVQNGRVEIACGTGEMILADHLVVATQANSASQILPSLDPREREMLDSFEYEEVEIALHRDESFMPPKRRDWSVFNMLTNRTQTAAMCTVWMNQFCPEWNLSSPILQTITPFEWPDSRFVIGRRKLQRPVVNWRSLAGLKRLSKLHDEPGRRIWFCGSYAGVGVPLLESGVHSAIAVAQALGVSVSEFETDYRKV
jgi:predicted NAD/FAD-binding protein